MKDINNIRNITRKCHDDLNKYLDITDTNNYNTPQNGFPAIIYSPPNDTGNNWYNSERKDCAHCHEKDHLSVDDFLKI